MQNIEQEQNWIEQTVIKKLIPINILEVQQLVATRLNQLLRFSFSGAITYIGDYTLMIGAYAEKAKRWVINEQD